jgi:hypothetical protein
MRTVRDMRLAGLIAYLAALLGGLLASWLLHLILGPGGQLSWNQFNFTGVLEGIVFSLGFTLSLWIAKRAVRVSSTALLSAGLFSPTSARKLATPLPLIEVVDPVESRLAVLIENGKPVGVLGLDDNLVLWEDAPVVAGQTAASELAPLLWKYPAVIVADGGHIHGYIRLEAFLKYLSS